MKRKSIELEEEIILKNSSLLRNRLVNSLGRCASTWPSTAISTENESDRLVEGVAGVGVGGVADARHGRGGRGDLLGARGGDTGGVGATEVVHDDGVGPVGLDGGVVVVHALVAGDRAVDAGVHGRDLIVVEPVLSNVVVVDVEGT
jgi:hypothetical protein